MASHSANQQPKKPKAKGPRSTEDASTNSAEKPEPSPKGSLALEIIQELQEKSVPPMEG